MGGHIPQFVMVVPSQLGDPGLQHRLVIQAELVADALGVLEYLWCEGEPLLWYVARVLQKGEVQIGHHVALGPRVPVPIPGAPKVRAALDDAQALVARLDQPGRGHQAHPARSDDQVVHGVADRLTLERRRKRIFREVVRVFGERHPDELLLGVLPHPLVSLQAVLLG